MSTNATNNYIAMQANYATVTATDAVFPAADGRGWSVWAWGTTRRRHRLVVWPMVVVDAYNCLGFHGAGRSPPTMHPSATARAPPAPANRSTQPLPRC